MACAKYTFLKNKKTRVLRRPPVCITRTSASHNHPHSHHLYCEFFMLRIITQYSPTLLLTACSACWISFSLAFCCLLAFSPYGCLMFGLPMSALIAITACSTFYFHIYSVLFFFFFFFSLLCTLLLHPGPFPSSLNCRLMIQCIGLDREAHTKKGVPAPRHYAPWFGAMHPPLLKLMSSRYQEGRKGLLPHTTRGHHIPLPPPHILV